MALSNVPDLSAVRLLLHADHSKVKGGLFWEIRTQLSLNTPTEDELRTLLLESAEVLLLLDGYREGNQGMQGPGHSLPGTLPFAEGQSWDQRAVGAPNTNCPCS